MSERFDALVIGGGVSGLAAAALLAKAGRRTMLFEPSETLTAPAAEPVLRALDPRLVKELRLAKHGLKFAVRDLPLTLLRRGGQPLVISRDRHATQRAIASLSPADAAAFAPFQRERRALAAALRFTWWDGRPGTETAAHLKPAQRERFERLAVTSAACWLAETFETDALKAALAFDAVAAGFSPSEPGSALALLWTAAQEMCGLQGAVAIPRGGIGAVTQALTAAAKAAGATLRTGATVSRLLVNGDAVSGVELAAGEQIEAPLVFSSLRKLDGLVPAALGGLGAARAPSHETIGSATLVFGLNRLPDLGAPPRRIVIAERLETYETCFAAARLGRMPQEPVLELIFPPAEDPAELLMSRIQLFVRAWPVPLANFDKSTLAAAVTALLERSVPGFAAASCDVLTPHAATPSIDRLLAGAVTRTGTPLAGLFLCGTDAEPADAISGRAARLAVHAALKRGGAR